MVFFLKQHMISVEHRTDGFTKRTVIQLNKLNGINNKFYRAPGKIIKGSNKRRLNKDDGIIKPGKDEKEDAVD